MLLTPQRDQHLCVRSPVQHKLRQRVPAYLCSCAAPFARTVSSSVSLEHSVHDKTVSSWTSLMPSCVHILLRTRACRWAGAATGYPGRQFACRTRPFGPILAHSYGQAA